MHTLSYFDARSRFSGSAPAAVAPDRDIALFCSTCGDIWGRFGLLAPGNRRWFVISRGCRTAHARDLLDTPGSLLIDREFFIPWPAPRALLLRELDLAADGSGVAFPVAARYNPSTMSCEVSTMSPELITEIANLRIKAVEGTITDDELRLALGKLREDRRFAAAKGAAAKRTERAAAASPIDTDALLKSFF